ncbi:MAG: hypothetical protein ACI85L_002437 [Pseudomonadota bacterium]
MLVYKTTNAVEKFLCAKEYYLRAECRQIVELKLKIDNRIQELVNKELISCRGSYAATHPHDFLLKLLPFWRGDIQQRIEDSTVDSRQILSGTYRCYGDIEVTADYLNRINEASRSGYDKPSYHKVGELPLYVAWEGKNRVKIFSATNTEIVCKLKLTSYPASDSLLIHKAYFSKNVYFVSCNDSTFATRTEMVQVAHPEVVIPLLKAYGVQDGGKVFKPFSRPIEQKFFKELTRCLMSN